MRPIVFAGPSLSGLDLGDFDIALRPPARAGDILCAMRDGATRIGLIDGVFESAPAVRHKEILAALAAGVELLGAASMGALRASECGAFGMRGVGKIFAQYRSGERFADADVAVLHAPAEFGYKPLTTALVDVEATLAVLVATDELQPGDAMRLIEVARRLHYKQRTWPAVAAGALSVEQVETFLAAVRQRDISQKRVDALQLLAEITAPAPSGQPGRITVAELNRTVFLDALIGHLWGSKWSRPT